MDVEGDRGRLTWIELHAGEPDKQLVRPNDRCDVVTDVELHDLGPGTDRRGAHPIMHLGGRASIARATDSATEPRTMRSDRWRT